MTAGNHKLLFTVGLRCLLTAFSASPPETRRLLSKDTRPLFFSKAKFFFYGILMQVLVLQSLVYSCLKYG